MRFFCRTPAPGTGRGSGAKKDLTGSEAILHLLEELKQKSSGDRATLKDLEVFEAYEFCWPAAAADEIKTLLAKVKGACTSGFESAKLKRGAAPSTATEGNAESSGKRARARR